MTPLSRPFLVRLNFHGDLRFFLGRRSSAGLITRELRERTSIKDIIESCGVPHPEVDLIVIGERNVDFAHVVHDDLAVAVYSTQRSPSVRGDQHLQRTTADRFVADGHLGTLTRDLRLLGFDVSYDSSAQDRQLLRIMSAEERALLTRDRRLLMHKIVETGYCPRSQEALEQTVEVIRRFDLAKAVAPFTRCVRCNAFLSEVSKAEVIEQLEPLTKLYYDTFRRCRGCGQVYWRGSHFDKMQCRIEEIRAQLRV